MARSAMFDTGPLSCLGRFQTGRRTKALDVSLEQDTRWGMGRSGHSCTHRQPRIMARYRSNVFSEGLGRQKGLFRARYSRNVFPNTVFHCFSPLKTYIRSLCCQQHAVRACISATYCHEEALLPSGPPLGIHDNRFLPLFNAQPFHAEHSGGAPGERPTSDEGKRLARDRHRMREDAWRGARADREGVPDWRHPPFG